MTSRVRQAAVPALVLAAGGLLAACGIPLSNAAQPLTGAPPNLVDKTPTTTTTSPPAAPNAVTIDVYFLNAAATRLVKTTAEEPPPATPAEALGLLAYGPNQPDSNAGYQTALSTSPQATPSVKVDPKTEIATVTLDDTTEALFGSQLYEALAQIVYTITAPNLRARVNGVLFSYEGSSVLAYLGNGTWTSKAVTRRDYAELAPLQTRNTSTSTSTTLSTLHTPTRIVAAR